VNSRLDTLQAAILLPKLEILAEEIQLRQQVAERYSTLLAGACSVDAGPTAILATPFIEPHNTSAYAQYTLRVSDRSAVQARLEAAGIPTAVHYPTPLNRQPAVANHSARLPVGDAVAEQVLSLPMHPYLNEAEQHAVVAALQGAWS
jgi:UDP-2-acetamido-2-deoxy-ribo-hexuluronate aminotransferase